MNREVLIMKPNAKLTHGSLEAAGEFWLIV